MFGYVCVCIQAFEFVNYDILTKVKILHTCHNSSFRDMIFYSIYTQPVDFFLFLFRFLVEFNEFYKIKKLSMDGEHHYS